MSAQLQRFNINFRPAVPAEAELVKAANTAPMPAAVYLRGAALAGHALLAAGCRLLEDGSLLVPGPGGVLVQLRPAEIIAVAKRRDFLQGIGDQAASGAATDSPAAPVATPALPKPAPAAAAAPTPTPTPTPTPAPAPAPTAIPVRAPAATQEPVVSAAPAPASEAPGQADGAAPNAEETADREHIASVALRSLGFDVT